MTRLAPPAGGLLVLLVLVVAFALRDGVGPRPALPQRIDSETAYHLRRIELTLAADRAVTFDAFLDPPRGAAIPWPPVFDSLLAAIAQRALAGPAGDRAIGGVDEPALERLAARCGPVLGVLTTLLVLAATRALLGTGSGSVAALAAAGAYALLPCAVEDASFGLVHLSAWMALCAAAALWAGATVSTAREGLDLAQAALLGGLVCGVAIQSGAAAALFVPWIWFALLARARSSDGELALAARRAGLLFALVTGVVAALGAPDGGGAVGAASVPAGRWTAGASALAFVGALPFLAVLLRPRAGARLAFAAALAFALALAALAARDLSRALAPIVRASSELAEWGTWQRAWARPGGAPGSALWGDFGPAILLLPLGLLALAPRERRAGLGWLVGASVTCAAGSFASRALTPVFAPVLCVFAAAAGQRALGSGARAGLGPRIVLAPRAALAAAALVLGVLAWQSTALAPSREARVIDRDLLQALRWIRENTPSPGPWNAAATQKDWALLVPPAWGHLAAYHARRPSLASAFGTRVGTRAHAAALRATREPDPEALRALLRAEGVAYVFAGRAALAATPGAGRSSAPSSPEPALARLAREPSAAFEPVWTADARTDTGEPTAGALTILRVAPAPIPDSGPRLRAR